MATKKTELATMGSFTLNDVPKLLEKVNEQIKNIKGDREKSVRITEDLPGFGTINEIKDLDQLRSAYAYTAKHVKAVSEFDDVFSAISPKKLKPVKIGSYTAEQWQEEIITQYKEVTYSSKLEALEKIKKELMENLSAEQKFAESMNNVKDILFED